jgi:pimeloyl-ACP methyl ester carboxylesterase
MKVWTIAVGGVVFLYAAVVAGMALNQRRLIFFPSHDPAEKILEPWIVDGRIIGYFSAPRQPSCVWLMAHGNAGQASQRAYVLQRMAPTDALYVVEYPGYGARPGVPAMAAMNAAVADAYEILRRAHPATSVCVLGESIGSGPASMLATRAQPPDKIVLVVPFDVLANVAAGHFPLLPVRLVLKDRWDNVAALKSYPGPVDIFAADRDQVIPTSHARKLAAAVPQARLTLFAGAHNEWADSSAVRVER